MIQNKTYEIGTLGYKIALFGDLHYDIDYDLTKLDLIVENLKLNQPDYICITGDILNQSSVVNNQEIMIPLKEFFRKLGEIAPTIVTLGNHDIWSDYQADIDNVQEWFLSLNTMERVIYLYNKSFIRDNICFTAYNPPAEYYGLHHENTNIFIKNIDTSIHLKPQYYNILLSHSPMSVFKTETFQKSNEINKVNLILCGHMHNGLVLKWFDHKGTIGFISPYRKLFPKYARGLSTKMINNKKISMIVSGGVVKISKNHSKRLSIFNKFYPIHIEYINI